MTQNSALIKEGRLWGYFKRSHSYQFLLCTPWWTPAIKDGTDSSKGNVLRLLGSTRSLGGSLTSLILEQRATIWRLFWQTPADWLAWEVISIWPPAQRSPPLHRRTGYGIKYLTSRVPIIQRSVHSVTKITVLVFVSVNWFSRFWTNQLSTALRFPEDIHDAGLSSFRCVGFPFSWRTCHCWWIQSIIEIQAWCKTMK